MSTVSQQATAKAAYSIPARLDEHRVMLIDYSQEGLVLEHYRQLAVGTEATFALEWEGERVSILCRVALCEKFPVSFGSSFCVFRSRLAILAATGEVGTKIEKMIQSRHQVSIALQMANASGHLDDAKPHPVFRNGLLSESSTRPSSDRQAGKKFECIRLRWNGTKWASVWTLDPDQPADGFTIDADELPLQIQRLCEAYETTTEAGRNLIRLQAQLSLEGKQSTRAREH